MKIILSRKGFDSGSGGMASPILPDGTLLSMPIPSDDFIKYSDLKNNGVNYFEILSELKRNFNYQNCHLDPDIRANCINRPSNWVAAFGQSDQALSHLNNQGVDCGDIFLFYGWFRQTEYTEEGKLRFVKNAPDLHVIYGYLQVGKVLREWDEIKQASWHPHANIKRKNDKLNAIYFANDNFLDTDLPGFGVLNFSDELVLTKNGHSRSHWQLPECLDGKNMTYHKPSNYKEDYFQSTMRGQEFVIEADDHIMDWVKRIILK